MGNLKSIAAGFFLGITAVGLATVPASANVITTGCANANISCTLAELSGGGTIQVHDKLFTNWTGFSSFANGNAVLPVLADIDVFGVTGDPMNPGLRYNSHGEWSATGTTLSTLQSSDWSFEVHVVPGLGLMIHDNSLILGDRSTTLNPIIDDPQVKTDGINGIFINETVFSDVAPFNKIDGLGSKGVFDKIVVDALSQHLNDHIVFDPQNIITVFSSISLRVDVGNSVTLNEFTQTFSQISVVSEPATLAVFGLGLAGLGFAGRRQAA